MARAFPDTPAFHRWFARSVVRTRAGRPRVMYHGSDTRFSVFEPKETEPFRHGGIVPPWAATISLGWYFAASAEDARFYGQVVTPVYLRMENPLAYPGDDQFGTGKRPVDGKLAGRLRDMAEILAPAVEDGAIAHWTDALGPGGIAWTVLSHPRVVGEMGARGYDGTWVDDWPTKTAAFVLYPEQIKAAGNRGTFDPADPGIYRNPSRKAPTEEELLANYAWPGAPSQGVFILPSGTLIRHPAVADHTTLIQEIGYRYVDAFLRAVKAVRVMDAGQYEIAASPTREQAEVMAYFRPGGSELYAEYYDRQRDRWKYAKARSPEGFLEQLERIFPARNPPSAPDPPLTAFDPAWPWKELVARLGDYTSGPLYEASRDPALPRKLFETFGAILANEVLGAGSYGTAWRVLPATLRGEPTGERLVLKATTDVSEARASLRIQEAQDAAEASGRGFPLSVTRVYKIAEWRPPRGKGRAVGWILTEDAGIALAKLQNEGGLSEEEERAADTLGSLRASIVQRLPRRRDPSGGRRAVISQQAVDFAVSSLRRAAEEPEKRGDPNTLLAVADAVEWLARIGVYWLDFHANNVTLDEQGQTRVIDYGFSQSPRAKRPRGLAATPRPRRDGGAEAYLPGFTNPEESAAPEGSGPPGWLAEVRTACRAPGAAENAGNPRPRRDAAEGRAMLESLIREHGITDDPRKGGYILPDGRFLDLSAGGDFRADDHRIVNRVLPKGEKLRIGDNRTLQMYRVMGVTGMIRWSPEAWNAEVAVAPSSEQAATLRRLAEFPRDPKEGLTVEIADADAEPEKMTYAQLCAQKQESIVWHYSPNDAYRVSDDLAGFFGQRLNPPAWEPPASAESFLWVPEGP